MTRRSGTGGATVDDFTASDDSFEDVLVDPDGSVVAVGGAGDDFLVARYLADGQFDTSFGDNGKAITDFPFDPALAGGRPGVDRAFAVARQADGKLLVAGYHADGFYKSTENWALARYNPDGSPDLSFGDAGRRIVISPFRTNTRQRAYEIIPLDGGKFLVAGESDDGTSGLGPIIRFNPDGSIDTTFHVRGQTILFRDYQAMALQPDGKIVAARGDTFPGPRLAVARFLPDGTGDNSFGFRGEVELLVPSSVYTPVINDIEIGADGRIVVAGGVGGDFAIASWNAFGNGMGIVTTNFGGADEIESLRLLPGGAMLAAGTSSSTQVALARYLSDGALDTTFGAAGTALVAPAPSLAKVLRAAEFAPDGRITAAGNANRAGLVARVLVDGPPTGSVVGRHVYYNGSVFDDYTGAPAGIDSGAIDPTKTGLLPGQAPTFANVTSYTCGINGVAIDIAGLPAGVRLTAADFIFRAGPGPDPASLVEGPAPREIALYPTAGAEGSGRIFITWRDYEPSNLVPSPYAVGNGWLEVTVKANNNTCLAAPDVFYFGNLIGETGDRPSRGAWRVGPMDALTVFRRPGPAPTPAFRTDFNHDGVTNALDLATARRAFNAALPVLTWSPPAAAALPTRIAAEEDRASAAVIA